MVRLSAFVLFALALALAACDSNEPVVASCENESIEVDIDTLATGNCCATVRLGDRVRVDYAGTLEDGTEFDSNPSAVFTVAVAGGGRPGLISGFAEGLLGMQTGERRRITIPPYRGYGTVPQQDADGNVTIPACSGLIFDVELIDILS